MDKEQKKKQFKSEKKVLDENPLELVRKNTYMSSNGKSFAFVKLEGEELKPFMRVVKSGLNELKEREKRARQVISELETDALKDFTSKKPLDRWTLLRVISLLKVEHMAKVESFVEEDRSQRARDSVKSRYENDTKQKEKLIVYECWQNWQKKPEQYTSNTKFASAMLDKFRPDNPEEEDKHLNSVKVITNWCREWKKK